MKKTIVIILAIVVAAAIGFFAYRNQQINTARSKAISQVESIDTGLYDGDELSIVENYIADAKSKLESSKELGEFSTIVDELNKNVSKVKTTAQKQKEKEEAERKAVEEEARRQAEAAAAAQAVKKTKKASGSADSNGCVGGGSSNFY
ncbi:MAG: hypothetical protein MJ127_01985 [Mogibacterium sp.]|nr:hypothetical protein [Mogibacterium sp.]